jgi:hypothetical protein
VAADAGTAHRFQGREFDYVVFDLVEDGTTDGWMAQADPTGNSWQREGVRLFNVAATRARRRLYLICSRSAVDAKARGHQGAPLKVVRELMKAGRIRVVRATERIASHVRRRAALAPSDQLGGSKGVSSDPPTGAPRRPRSALGPQQHRCRPPGAAPRPTLVIGLERAWKVIHRLGALWMPNQKAE